MTDTKEYTGIVTHVVQGERFGNNGEMTSYSLRFQDGLEANFYLPIAASPPEAGQEKTGVLTRQKNGQLKFSAKKKQTLPPSPSAEQRVAHAADQAWGKPDSVQAQIIRQSSMKAAIEACKLRWPNGIPEGTDLKTELKTWADWFADDVFNLGTNGGTVTAQGTPTQPPAVAVWEQAETQGVGVGGDDSGIPF